jgi:plastocyanin
MPRKHQIIIPREDRFNPFALTIKCGDIVTWINDDCHPHTITSLDQMNSTGPKSLDQIIPPGNSF